MEHECAGDREGTAHRRRERRFRSFLRHERMSVAMALAEYQHHSSRGNRTARAMEDELYDVPWHQMSPPPRMWLAALREPGPQEAAVTVGYVAFACCAAACGVGRLGLRRSRLPHSPRAPEREEGEGEEGGRGGKAGGVGLAARAPEVVEIEVEGAGGGGSSAACGSSLFNHLLVASSEGKVEEEREKVRRRRRTGQEFGLSGR